MFHSDSHDFGNYNSGGLASVSLRKIVPYEPELVFAAVSDHERLPQWLLPGARVITTVNQAGHTVREIRKGLFAGKEEILSCRPPRKLEYRIVSGLPVRHHHATVLVDRHGSAHSTLTWTVEYDSGFHLLDIVVRRSIRMTIEKGLARLPEYLRCTVDRIKSSREAQDPLPK